MSYSNELGLIFIVNYPVLPATPGGAVDPFVQRLFEFDKGVFNFDAYQPHKKVAIWFVSCRIDPDSDAPTPTPNTLVTKLMVSKDGKGWERDDSANMSFGAINLGNKDVLSTILIYITKTSNASRYGVFLYNHSSAFGMFNANPVNSAVTQRVTVGPKPMPVPFISATETFLTPDEASVFVNRENWFASKGRSQAGSAPAGIIPGVLKDKNRAIMREEISSDYQEDMLTNAELLIALSKAITINGYQNQANPTIEVLFSAGCYALNIDLAYALSGTVHYLVGAEGIMPAFGYDYPAIVNGLIGALGEGSSADIDFNKVICETMGAFGKEYDLSKPDQREWLKSTYVTAVDCSMVPKLKGLIDSLSFQLMGQGEAGLLNLSYSRVSCVDLTDTYFGDRLSLYDIGQLLWAIRQYIPGAGAICDQIAAMLADIKLKCEFCEKDLLDPALQFSGMTIYLPIDVSDGNNKLDYDSFYSNISPSESFFSRECYWTTLIALFLRYRNLCVKGLQQ